jgi:hypothetical protein
MSTFRREWPGLLCSLLVAVLASSTALAQTVTGTISGTVVDGSSAVIAGARVTLIHERTGNARILNTDEGGRFSFAALQPGIYALKTEATGFQTLERKGTVLSANEHLALGNLELSAGQVSETVTVTTEGARVETQSSDLTARLTADQISLISTKGRDVTSLLRLLPGTSNNDDIEAVGEGFGTDLPNISGQRGRSTVSSIDGLNASEPSGSNKLSMTINQDAVAEVKVLRNNYAAEYGNNGGAIINLVSKGGTMDYSGSAYYFLRNEALNANQFFNNKVGIKRPLYRHNIWGGTFGGPLPLPPIGGRGWTRNKTFFFFSYEKPHQITPQDPRFVTVPTALERQGDFSQSLNSANQRVFVRDPRILTGNCNATDQSACFRDPSRATAGNPLGLNIIPQSRFNPSGQALLSYFPLPNAVNAATATGGVYNYVVQTPVDVPKQSILMRFDVKPTDRDSIYVKAQWWTSDNEGTGTSGWPGGDNNRWGISSHYLYKDNGWSANWVHLFSPTLVNEFNFGMRHDSEGFVPSDGEIERLQRTALNYTAPQLFPENNKLGTIPRATGWGGVLGVAPANINWLDRWGEIGNDYIRPSFANNLSLTRGDHNYKFGMYYERLLNGEAPGGQWSGVFNFSGNDNNFTAALGNTGYAYANALVGNFRNYQESQARPFTNLSLTMLQWYAQDQWKVNRQFTLNYGVRFGYHSPFTQIDEQGSNFDPRLFDPGRAVSLFESACAVAFTPPATCPSAQRRARNPVTGQLLPLTGANAGLIGAIVPDSGEPNNGLAIGTDPNTPRGYRKTRPVDFEPRIGFAWDIRGQGKTVLRAMGGVYHAPRVGGGTTGGNLVNNQPANRTLSIDFGSIDQLASLTGTALIRPSSINAVEVDSKTPATYNVSLGIQQDIGLKTVMEVSYVGSFTRHLGERRNINGVPDGARLGTNNIDPVTGNRLGNDFLRPFRGYADINLVTWSGTSNYNSLQVQVNRRYTQGFQYGVAYTYSKSLDYANDDSDDVSFPRPYKAFNYGPSNFDQTHILTFNYIYDVPGLSRRWQNAFARIALDGWQISGTTSYASGKPKALTVTYTGGTTDLTGGQVNARPNVICDPTERPGTFDPTGTPYLINPACFAKPTVLGDIGNLGRNIVRLPSTFNSDLALFKSFSLGEKRRIQFRWETYNLFNQTNFRDIDGAMTFSCVAAPAGTTAPAPAPTCTTALPILRQTNTQFGAPTSARFPRVMQGSLRFSF